MMPLLPRAGRRLAPAAALALAATTATLAAGAAEAPAHAATTPVIANWSSDESVDEGGVGEAVLRFRRTGDLSRPSSVRLTITDGTARRGSDFTASTVPTTIRFKVGEEVKIHVVPIKDDDVSEPAETFGWSIFDPVGATIEEGSGTVTILDEDTEEAPSLSIGDDVRYEGGPGAYRMTFAVTRAGSTASRVSVKVRTVPGSATSPSDYQAKSPTRISFAPGETTRLVLVTTKGDLEPEPDESFDVALSDPVGASIADGVGTGSLVNDDSSATPALSIYGGPVGEGDTTHAVTMYARRNGDLRGTSTVTFTTSDGTAVAPGDYTARTGTITWRRGQSEVPFTIVVKGDRVAERDAPDGPAQETFYVTLSDPAGGTIADGSAAVILWDDD